jgi:CoA:oxalate CoA-transferase
MLNMMLDGVRVIDFTTTVAGPACSQFLSQVGAEVIKIESPVKVDDARYYPPYKGSFSVSFAAANNCKKSVTVDLKKPEGVAIFKDLVKASDVFLENYTPGTVKRLGIDYDALRQVNERLIMCSISAYGQTGPLSSLPGYDATIQAMTGLMSVTGYPDRPPLRAGTLIVDISTAFCAAFSICAALYARQLTGKGTHLDISMYDVGINLLESKFVDYTTTGKVATRTGNRFPFIAPFDTFRTKDSYVMIICAGDGPFKDLCNGMGMPDLCRDERFKDLFTRNDHEPELKKIIEEWAMQLPTEVVVERLLAAGAPAAAVHDIKQAVDHPHTRARNLFNEVDQPDVGKLTLMGSPVKASGYQVGQPGYTHASGEDNLWLLKDILGKSETEINKLKESKVVS